MIDRDCHTCRHIRCLACFNSDNGKTEWEGKPVHRLELAEALIETIENVYPDICDMAQYRAWKEAGR